VGIPDAAERPAPATAMIFLQVLRYSLKAAISFDGEFSIVVARKEVLRL
jgi:hypothetical protein